jgi:hypothetical protein
MTDATLIKLATIEWHELTDDAKLILTKEIEKRKINLYHADDNEQIHTPATVNFKQVEKHIIQYISEQKLNNESDAYILGGLLERGIEETTAVDIINSFPKYLEERKNNMSQIILTSTLQMASGLAIIELPLRKETQLAVIILGYSLLILGSFRIFHGFMNKKKINKMLKDTSH